MTDNVLPLTPYAGTSGWSGSATSRERAHREDTDGTTEARQRAVLAYLAEQGWYGATVNELVDNTPWHHGQASGALSNLHKAGLIARLAGREHRRQRCAPYVTLANVGGRETAPYVPNKGRPLTEVPDADLWAEVERREAALGWTWED